jgi:ubiquinol-cytochrome c reductase cytochrome c subunit
MGTTNGPSLVGQGAAAVDYVLTTGRMPLPHPGATVERRPPAYDAETIAALDAYVGSLVGGPGIPTVEPGDDAAGGVIYRAQCAACHQWGAQGGALLHREAPSLDQATPTQIAEAVRLGPGSMPVFGEAAFDDSQLNDLIAYIQVLQHPQDRGGNPLWHLGPLAEGGLALLVVGLMLVGLRLMGSAS